MSSTYYGIGLCIWSLWCFIKVVLRALPLLTCVDLAALLFFFLTWLYFLFSALEDRPFYPFPLSICIYFSIKVDIASI